MRRPPAVISCATLIAALALAGCGSSTSTSLTSIQFKSADIPAGHSIPALYTCDGKNTPPPLEWGVVPSGTGQLVLLVVGLTPTGVGNNYTVSIEWAVAGIAPGLHRLAAGQLPPEAYVGLASDGQKKYSICPKRGVRESYQFTLYAVPASLAIARNFEGVLALSALSKPNTATSALAHGAFVTVYKRI